MSGNEFVQAIMPSTGISTAVRSYAYNHGIVDPDEYDAPELLTRFYGRWRVGIANELNGELFQQRAGIVIANATDDPGHAGLMAVIPAPVASTTVNIGPGLVNLWDYSGITIPPGALTRGAILRGRIDGRFTLENVTGRTDIDGTADHVTVVFSLDPNQSALVQDNRMHGEVAGSTAAANIGWNPDDSYDVGSVSDDGSALLVTHTLRHGITLDDEIRFAVPDGSGLAVPPDLLGGKRYFAGVSYEVSITTDGTTTVSGADLAGLDVGDPLVVVLAGATGLSGTYEILSKPTATTATICTLPTGTSGTPTAVSPTAGTFVATATSAHSYRVMRQLSSDGAVSGATSASGAKTLQNAAFAAAEIGDKVYISDAGTSGITVGLYDVTNVAGNVITLNLPGNASATVGDVECQLYANVQYNLTDPLAESDEVVAVRFGYGSMHQLTWCFSYAVADEIVGPHYYTIHYELIAMGRTSSDQKGIIGRAVMEVSGFGEEASYSKQNNRKLITGQEVLKRGPTIISRVTPGNGQNTSGIAAATPEDLPGAPLILAKQRYYTDSTSTSFTTATANNAADTLSHSSFSALRVGNSITISNAGTSGIGTGTKYVRQKTDSTTIQLATTSSLVTLVTVSGDSVGNVQGSFGPLSFNAYDSTMWDYGGQWDVVSIDKRLFGGGFYPGSSVAITSATYNAAARVLQQAGAFTSYSFSPGETIYISNWGNSTGGTAGFFEIEAKLASNRIKLVAGQSGLPTGSTSSGSVVGHVDFLPLVSYLGEDAGSAQTNEYATATHVVRDGEVIGDVVYHDNIKQELFVRLRDPSEHVIYGDSLTLNTYKREKTSGTGSWGFGVNSTTPYQTFSVTAGRVKHGPQDTRIAIRVGVDGDQNGDVELEVRSGEAFIMRRKSG